MGLSESHGGRQGQRHPVRDVVSRIEDMNDRGEVPLRDLLEACGPTTFVPALMVPALLVVTPLSGIPLFSSFCGIAIALIAAQMLWKRDHLWLPDFIMKRTVPGEKLRAADRPLHRMADFLDRYSRPGRLHQFVGRGSRVIPQALCVAAGVLMPVLELVPFSSSILGTAVLCFSVSFLTRDGLFVIPGIAIMGVLAIVAGYMLL